MDDEHKTPTSVSEGHRSTPLSVASDDNSSVQMENNFTSTSESNTENSQSHPLHLGEAVSADQVNKVSESLKSIALATASDNKGRFLL